VIAAPRLLRIAEIATSGRFRAGTSGWNYPDWKGVFYPPELKSRDYLSWYCRHFDTTEVNYSFYHLPKKQTFENWAAQTPQGFLFALKASRVISHVKRLEGVDEQWRRFLDSALALGSKLGPVLLQFPPSFKASTTVLERFLLLSESEVSRRVELAFEFRHSSWFDPEICQLLRRHKAALVIAHSQTYPQAPLIPTAPFVYVRFHGPQRLFASRYSTGELETWATRVKRWLSSGHSVYAYFNNDFHGYAIENARELSALVTARQHCE
jgi:uncharacterized protein YecE (DUF72 family)